MNKTILLFGLFLILTSFGIEDYIWKAPKDRYLGKVKNCRQEIFYVDSQTNDSFLIGEIPLAKIKLNYFRLFNESGEITKELIYNIDSTIRLTTNYDYEKYQETRTEIVGGEIKSIMNLTYNQKGNILSYKVEQPKYGVQRLTKYIYDSNKLRQQVEHSSSDKSVSSTYDYFYTGNRVDSIILLDKNGLLIKKWLFKNVDNLVTVEEIQDSSVIKRYRREYYDSGEISLLETAMINSLGNVGTKMTYGYDKLGNQISYEQPGEYPFGVSQTNEFVKLDSKGNWIERVIYESDKPVYFLKRTFEYYE